MFSYFRGILDDFSQPFLNFARFHINNNPRMTPRPRIASCYLVIVKGEALSVRIFACTSRSVTQLRCLLA
jgi:hypothetical protein